MNPTKKKKYTQLYKNFHRAFWAMNDYAEQNANHIPKRFVDDTGKLHLDEDILLSSIKEWYREYCK